MYNFQVKSKTGKVLYKGIVQEPPAVVTASKVKRPSIQSMIDAAKPGDLITIPHGYYHESVTIDRQDIEIEGAGKVVIGGWRSVPEPTNEAIKYGKMFRGIDLRGLDMQTSKNSSVTESHNDAMHPANMMYQPGMLPGRAGRIMLKQCFDIGTYIAHASAGAPCFYVHGDYRQPEYIACYIKNGDYLNLYYSDRPSLLTFSDGSARCSLENVEIDGAANTKKRGALWVRGENHILDSVQSTHSSSVGIRVNGSNHSFTRVRGDYNGQMGWFGSPQDCTFYECYNSYNNLYGLFDSSWEAGHKFVNSKGNKVKGWRGDFNNGPGFWLDISNFDWDMYNLGFVGNSRAALQIEHYAENIQIEKCIIDGVEKGGRNGTSIGLQVQSHIKNCDFIDFEITDCDEAIRYKKEEKRGPSGLNNFIRIQSQDPFVIEGTNDMPDVMKDVPRLIQRNK